MGPVRSSLLAGLASFAVAAAPFAAAAKDFCVSDSEGGMLKFRKVASLKKPGHMVALHGLLLLTQPEARGEGGGEGEGAVETAPVVGTAVVLAEGVVKVGVAELGSGVPSGLGTATASLITDVLLVGTGAIDFDGDTVQDQAYSWQALDCDAFDLLAGF
jgi:hypothetical protein